MKSMARTHGSCDEKIVDISIASAEDSNSGGGGSGSESDTISSTNGSSRTGNTSVDKTDHIISQDGVMFLAGARCCFILTLVIAAAVMAAVVFIILTDAQTADFQNEV